MERKGVPGVSAGPSSTLSPEKAQKLLRFLRDCLGACQPHKVERLHEAARSPDEGLNVLRAMSEANGLPCTAGLPASAIRFLEPAGGPGVAARELAPGVPRSINAHVGTWAHFMINIRTTDRKLDESVARLAAGEGADESAMLMGSPHAAKYPNFGIALRCCLHGSGLVRYYEVSSTCVPKDMACAALENVELAAIALLKAKELAQCPDDSTCAFARHMGVEWQKGK